MAIWQGRSKKKPTGGRNPFSRGKKRFEIGREKSHTRVGPQTVKKFRGRGGGEKRGLLAADYANVINKETNVVSRVKIVGVKVNPADPNYVQRNIINKGATIVTEIGDAVVTSRPGQDGTVNAVLVS
ncbi:MAG: 30S ribosomal protein S8e [Thermoplasmatales archaeon]|nr:30S ribosomal protein S8e [Thermoplasmatales archaeon]